MDIAESCLLGRDARWLLSLPDARTWINALSRKIDKASSKWGLSDIAESFPTAGLSFVARAFQGKESVVLKIAYPDKETYGEPDALRVWAGNGAVSLLDNDPVEGSLLLPFCAPGVEFRGHLRHVGRSVAHSESVNVLGPLLSRLMVSTQPGSFLLLEKEAILWRQTILDASKDRYCSIDRDLLLLAVRVFDKLLETMPSESILMHQDLHAGNIILHDDSWIAIDPKPIVGDPSFVLSPILRDLDYGSSLEQTFYRLNHLSRLCAIDRTRARDWAFGQSVCWALWSRHRSMNYEQVARWLIRGP